MSKIDECTTYNLMVEKQRRDNIFVLGLDRYLDDTLAYVSTFESTDTSYDCYMCLVHLFDAYTYLSDRDSALGVLAKIERIRVEDEDALYSEISHGLLHLGLYDKAYAYAELHVKFISERFSNDHTRGPLLVIDALSLLLLVVCRRDPADPEVQELLTKITRLAANRYNSVDTLLECLKILFPLGRVAPSALPVVEYLMYGVMSLASNRPNSVKKQLRELQGWVAELAAGQPALECGGKTRSVH